MTTAYRPRIGLSSTAGPKGPARLLPTVAAVSYAEHTARLGPLPTPGPGELVAMLDGAGLLGRGGGGFPTARKLAAVAAQSGRQRRAVVVANCCEGDPTSAKDRVLIGWSAHLVIDGALAAAAALDADRVILAVHRGATAEAHLRTALAQRPRETIRVEILQVPARFIASEASALASFLTNGDARPLGRLQPIWEKGVAGCPTLVDNAETLAHLALITRFGADWYRSVGTAAEPGTALVTIGGVVPRPGVLEVAHGTAIRDIMRGAGAPATGWALVGGLAGRWNDLAAIAGVGFSTQSLAAAGSSRGIGSITVLPTDGCLLRETAGILHYLADAGAGQCGPCMFGLPAIAADMAALDAGDRGAVKRLRRRLPVIDHRGACSHPDGAVALAASALAALTGPQSAHLRLHLNGRACRQRPATVPLN